MSIVVNKTRLPVTEWQTESGSVVSISDARKRYAKSLSVALEPIQDLSHGDPSPTNLCPISGRSSVTAYDDPKYGGTIEWNQLVLDGNFPTTDNWRLIGYGDFAVNNNKAILTITNGQTYDTFLRQSCSYTKGHKILIDMYFKVTTESTAQSINFCVGYRGDDNGTHVFRYDSTRNQNVRYNGIFTLGYDANLLYVGKIGAYGALNTGDTIEIWNMQIFDLTQMFGAGNEPTLEQFLVLFPKDYYPYNAGTETLVSAVNGDPCWNVSVSLGQTIYGGIVDLVSGVGTLTAGYLQKNTANMNNYEDYPGWKSSGVRAMVGDNKNGKITNAILNVGTVVYANTQSSNDTLFLPKSTYNLTQTEWKALALDCQFVIPLATPITYQLTPTQIEMLMRNNTIWSDDGIVTVNYARIRT